MKDNQAEETTIKSKLSNYNSMTISLRFIASIQICTNAQRGWLDDIIFHGNSNFSDWQILLYYYYKINMVGLLFMHLWFHGSFKYT